MGMTGVFRHPEPAGAPVVAFDFDGTLTCRDSFVAFLTWRAGATAAAAGALRLLPAALTYAVRRDRGALKAAVADRLLGPVRRARLQADAQRFCDERYDSLMRSDAVACWDDWRRRGARLFIVTASPDILVAPFARRLAADGLIGTRLAFDREERFTGCLDGPNCRGPEKVSRLRAELGPTLTLQAAYGDTDGDREMLALAETPGLKVFTARP